MLFRSSAILAVKLQLHSAFVQRMSRSNALNTHERPERPRLTMSIDVKGAITCSVMISPGRRPNQDSAPGKRTSVSPIRNIMPPI